MNENLKLSKKSLRLILKRANSNLSPTKIINQLIKNEDEKDFIKNGKAMSFYVHEFRKEGKKI